MVKKLRYYARFIVVSLLLNKVDLVKELIQVIISLAVVHNKLPIDPTTYLLI